MHIPDGFLNTPIWVGMWIISIFVVGYAIRKTNKKLKDQHIPLMGVLAAFIFAAQMLNVPIAVGTSGHLLGGVMVAIFLGPFAGTIIMASVFILQSILFQDGGITALGANIFNMGIIGTILGYYIFHGIKSTIGGKNGMIIGAAVAGWIAVVLASVAVSIELYASGIVPLKIVLPPMVGVHALIGLIEAGVTVAVLTVVMRSRPDLLELDKI
ncbi:MAG: energy-coupling factor ABC transporter permease [Halobacteriota archaeon]|nr:energy-coupling factor ABC transporter permease [Halobacteriota archaeon]